MFRILSIIVIVVSFIWLSRLLNKNNFSFTNSVSSFFTAFKKSLFELKQLKSKDISSKLGWIKSFFYLSTLLLFLLMFISAFLNVIFIGDDLTGFFLLVHLTVAPLFSVFLAILIILFAHSNRFTKNDVDKITDNSGSIKSEINYSGYLKIVFWLIALLSIPTMISIILSMFPLFGTNGQQILLNIHRYSTLIIVLLVIFHIGLVSVNSIVNNSNK